MPNKEIFYDTVCANCNTEIHYSFGVNASRNDVKIKCGRCQQLVTSKTITEKNLTTKEEVILKSIKVVK